MGEVINIDKDALKRTVKEALREALTEDRHLVHEILAEVIEDLAIGEAIKKGRETDICSREDVFKAIEGQG